MLYPNQAVLRGQSHCNVNPAPTYCCLANLLAFVPQMGSCTPCALYICISLRKPQVAQGLQVEDMIAAVVAMGTTVRMYNVEVSFLGLYV